MVSVPALASTALVVQPPPPFWRAILALDAITTHPCLPWCAGLLAQFFTCPARLRLNDDSQARESAGFIPPE